MNGMFSGGLLVATPSGASAKKPRTSGASSGSAGVNEQKMQALGEAVGQIFPRLRTVEAGVGRHYIVDKTVIPVQRAKTQLGEYNELVKAEGKGHKRGSPHGYGALGFMAGISECNMTDPQKATLQALALKAGDAIKMGHAVTIFRVSQCFKDEHAKIRIAYSAEVATMGVPAVIDAIMEAMGAEIRAGDAPQNPAERKIRELFNLNQEKA